MPCDIDRPDLTAVLPLDMAAPRAARRHVALVDGPTPDLRDDVVLLTSELVSTIAKGAAGGTIELRVWMPPEVVRVEVLAAPVVAAPATTPPRYSGVLVERLADRWHTETDGTPGALWFEIDRRRPTSGVSRSGPAGRAE